MTMITIEIVFAAKNTFWQQTLTLPAGATVQEALEQSRLFHDHPEAQHLAVGIFGERCHQDTRLQAGDRIEVYRPLVFDPMESRRRRAAHRANQQTKNTRRRTLSAAARMVINREG